MAGLRILITEDDDKLAELVAGILGADDRFEVVGRAADGEQAVSLAGELHPDIVLMDIAMPGTDGLAATQRILADDARQRIVIFTGSDEFETMTAAQDLGAAGYLHKDALTSPDLADALFVLHLNQTRAQ